MIPHGADAVGPIETQYGTLRTRPEAESDAAFLLALHESVKGAEFALMPVSDPIRRQLLDMEFRAMTKSYRSDFPAGRFQVFTLNETPIGRLITDRDAGRFHIVYVALLPEWRNKGIGTVLMTSVLHEPRRRGVPCEATVAVNNLASLRLWSRLGFTERRRDITDIVLEWRPG
jgi:ribosomal protein S18 acetylase RimI-like enzyme